MSRAHVSPRKHPAESERANRRAGYSAEATGSHGSNMGDRAGILGYLRTTAGRSCIHPPGTSLVLFFYGRAARRRAEAGARRGDSAAHDSRETGDQT
jgi:hypothetical protein